MKAIKISLLLMIMFAVVQAGIVTLDSFRASSNGKSIVVEWKSSTENGIAFYDLERATPKQAFKKIASFEPRGSSNSYSYTDDEVFMKGDGGDNLQAKSTYQYRLKVIYRDNSSEYTNIVYVAHNVSGVQRTWGMIKEMFR